MNGAVRVAQIGCGHWGKNLARNFAEIGVLAAVVDDSAETAQAIAGANGVAAAGLEEVLADTSITAVSFATPAATHAQLALRAVQAGKHVYVEKPLALDPADGAELVGAAARKGVTLMVGHLLRYHPGFVTLIDAVRSGAIGRPTYIYSNRLSLGKLRTEENVLWSFAPHDFSMILALADEEPVEISAHGAVIATPGIADWCMSRFAFRSGLRGHVLASWLHPFKEHRLVVTGESGMIVFEDSQADPARKLALYRHQVDRSGPGPVTVKADPEYLPLPTGEPLRLECQHFVDCVVAGRKPVTDGEEGLRVLRALDRAQTALDRSLAGGSE